MSVWRDGKRDYWVAKFQNGKKQYKKQGFENRSEAIIWEAEKRKELDAPEVTEIPSVSFQEVATAYLKHCEARMALNTVRQKAFEYRSFIASTGNHKIENVSKSMLAGHLAKRREKKGNKAANRSLKDLKALCNWAMRNDIVDFKNPSLGLERFPEDPSVRYIPPVEDIDKVLMVADREEMDLLMVLYHTLGRIGEVLRLTWEDVNFEKRWVRLFTRKRRGGELQEDFLPMNDTLHGVLLRRWQRRDKESPLMCFQSASMRGTSCGNCAARQELKSSVFMRSGTM